MAQWGLGDVAGVISDTVGREQDSDARAQGKNVQRLKGLPAVSMGSATASDDAADRHCEARPPDLGSRTHSASRRQLLGGLDVGGPVVPVYFQMADASAHDPVSRLAGRAGHCALSHRHTGDPATALSQVSGVAAAAGSRRNRGAPTWLVGIGGTSAEQGGGAH